jgi:hypothetical protein
MTLTLIAVSVTIGDIQPARLVQSDRPSESSALLCATDSCLGPPVVIFNSPCNWPPRLAVVIPHTLGNWRTCYTPLLRCPRSTTRQLASCRTAARQHPVTAALLPGNCRMRPTHAPLHLYRPEQTVLFRTPQTLQSGLSIGTTENPTLDLYERRMLYYCLIYPHLSFGIIVWGQSAKTLTRRILYSKKGQ